MPGRFVQVESQVGVIRAGKNLWLWDPVNTALLFHHPYKRVFGRHSPVRLPQVFDRCAGMQAAMRGRQHAAHQVDRGYRQGHVGQAEFLHHLGGVAVSKAREGPHHAAALRVVATGVAFCAAFRRPHLDLQDDWLGSIQQAGFDQRQQRQDPGSGVAAHPADVAGLAQLLAVQLGQPVDEALEPFRGRVLAAVPARVLACRAQAKISGKVDQPRSQAGVVLDLVLGLPMRQGQEEHVAGFEKVGVAELHPGLLAQVGVHLVNVLSQVLAGSSLGKFNLGMGVQQAQQLASGIT